MRYLVEGRWIKTDQRPTRQFLRSGSQFSQLVTMDGLRDYQPLEASRQMQGTTGLAECLSSSP